MVCFLSWFNDSTARENEKGKEKKGDCHLLGGTEECTEFHGEFTTNQHEPHEQG